MSIKNIQLQNMKTEVEDLKMYAIKNKIAICQTFVKVILHSIIPYE